MSAAGERRSLRMARAKRAATDLEKPRFYPTKAALALREKYETQKEAGEKPRWRKCLVCGQRFYPRRLAQFFCKTKRPDCKWRWWEAFHPRMQITARGGARRYR